MLKLALGFAAIYLIWGSTYLAVRYSVETIPPAVAAVIRDFAAGTILFVWAWLRGFRPKREHWIAGAGSGFFFFFIGHWALNWAEQDLPSGVAALLTATEPMFITVFGWISGQQRVSGVSAIGLIVGVLGVSFLAAPELSTESSVLPGMIAVVLAAVSWAAGVTLSTKMHLPTDPLARTAMPLVCAAVMLLIAASLTGELQRTRWQAISVGSVMGLGYLTTFGSLLAFTSYMWLLQHCSPTLVATHTYANPVVAVLLGWLFASETLNSRVVFACIAILATITLIRAGEKGAASGACRR